MDMRFNATIMRRLFALVLTLGIVAGAGVANTQVIAQPISVPVCFPIAYSLGIRFNRRLNQRLFDHHLQNFLVSQGFLTARTSAPVWPADLRRRGAISNLSKYFSNRFSRPAHACRNLPIGCGTIPPQTNVSLYSLSPSVALAGAPPISVTLASIYLIQHHTHGRQCSRAGRPYYSFFNRYRVHHQSNVPRRHQSNNSIYYSTQYLSPSCPNGMMCPMYVESDSGNIRLRPKHKRHEQRAGAHGDVGDYQSAAFD